MFRYAETVGIFFIRTDVRNIENQETIQVNSNSSNFGKFGLPLMNVTRISFEKKLGVLIQIVKLFEKVNYIYPIYLLYELHERNQETL